VVKGRVTYIQSVTVRPGFLVTVRTDGEYRASHLWLPTSWREKVENLRIGDLIAFEGKIDGIYVGDISLTDASFIMFEPKK